MTQPVRLLPLLCIRCQAPLPANPGEIAWACPQCGQGQMIDDETGLEPLEIHYLAGLNPDKPGKPYWVSTGRVQLARQTYSGNQTGQMQAFWGAGRRFFVPATMLQLDALVQTGMQLLSQPPELQPGPAGKFESVTVLPDDVPALAEFLLLSMEAGRKDALKKLDFTLTLDPPELWVLP